MKELEIEIKSDPKSDDDKTDKKSKTEVSYERGERKRHCGICSYYHWADPDLPLADGTCDLVKGYIDSAYVCNLFKNAKDKPEKDKE